MYNKKKTNSNVKVEKAIFSMKALRYRNNIDNVVDNYMSM